jgi:hypothetical protein
MHSVLKSGVTLLNQMHTPWESGKYIPIRDKSWWVPFCTHGATDKLIAGEPQPVAIFGYFFLGDGGPMEEVDGRGLGRALSTYSVPFLLCDDVSYESDDRTFRCKNI